MATRGRSLVECVRVCVEREGKSTWCGVKVRVRAGVRVKDRVRVRAGVQGGRLELRGHGV